jgi:hypothetical protein
MGMAYTRSATRSSVWRLGRYQVRSQAVSRDPIQAHGFGLQTTAPACGSAVCADGRDPRLEAWDTGRGP